MGLYINGKLVGISLPQQNTGDGSKYGVTIDAFLGDVDANGVLQYPTEQSDLVFTGVTDVADNVLSNKFQGSKSKSVSFPSLMEINGQYGCSSMFQDCTVLTSASFPYLTEVGSYACQSMFQGCTALTTVSLPNLTTAGYSALRSMFQGCTALTTISFPSLTTVSGSYVCQNMFQNCTSLTSVSFPELTKMSEPNSEAYVCENMFSGCTSLTTVSFPKLTTIGGSSGACRSIFARCQALTSISFPELTTINGDTACWSMFSGCTSLTSASFPKLNKIFGNRACYGMFQGCTALTDVYFPALTTTSFGSNYNQIDRMMSGTGTTTTHTLHFPSNLQSTISNMSGYPTFGGTSGYVTCLFDLPATS